MCPQTAKLLATIATSLPRMSQGRMQELIENPDQVRRLLKRALNPARIVRPARFWYTKTELPDFTLVVVTAASLGFANGQVTAGEICDRASQIGLVPCLDDYPLIASQEQDKGFIRINEPFNPEASHASYIQYVSSTHSSSGLIDLNAVFASATRWLFMKPKCKPSD
ncbi:MAG: hypothetical protein RL094_565 [Candidatus Parcubacteria bacterium]|jgi:hypothetical protein